MGLRIPLALRGVILMSIQRRFSHRTKDNAHGFEGRHGLFIYFGK